MRATNASTRLWTALLALLSAVSAVQGGDWTCISEGLFETIPDYADGKNHFVRRCGSLLTNPVTGDLFVLVSPRYGVWRSGDRGETWTRADANVVSGRTWGGDGCQFDPTDPNRMAFFTIVGAGAQPVAGMSLDGGKTWTAIHKPRGRRHDGWTAAQIDWTANRPSVIYGKEHHSERLWLSKDLGKSWTLATPEGGSYKVGMIADDVLLAGVGKGADPPIRRSTDEGKTWAQVHPPVFLCQRRPHVYGDRAYWATFNRILATADKGKTWKPTAPIVPDLPEDDKSRTWGPYFGRSEKEMLAGVNGHGFYRSLDGGATWTKLADWIETGKDFDKPREAFSIGWVPTQRLIYVAFLGGDAYRTKWDAKGVAKK
jgi:photosystem II stability/assembly factor-like uncharacterized protein